MLVSMRLVVLAAVSYTHLDVYKRQVQAHADGLGHFRGGDALVELLDLAFQINLYHRVLLSAGANKNLPQQSSGAGIRLKKNLPKPAVPPGFKGSRRRLFRFLVWACNCLLYTSTAP